MIKPGSPLNPSSLLPYDKNDDRVYKTINVRFNRYDYDLLVQSIKRRERAIKIKTGSKIKVYKKTIIKDAIREYCEQITLNKRVATNDRNEQTKTV